MRADELTTRTSAPTPQERADYRARAVALLLFSAVLGACGPKEPDTTTTMIADSAAAGRATAGGTVAGGSAAGAMPSKPTSGMAMGTLDTSAKNVGMTGMDHSRMEGMPGNPDQMFLHMMSDHHKGMIAMVHPAMEHKSSSAGVRADARKMDAAQDAELAMMSRMLKKDFGDMYKPTVQSGNQMMMDAMMKEKGNAYDHMFYTNTIAHHRQALTMIDEYSPKLTRSDLKAMAQKMKTDQTREIAEFERKMRP